MTTGQLNDQAGTAAGPDLAAAAHVREMTESSKSSFYWAMRLLPKHRRAAMFAVYAFCREIDDIADGTLPDAEKKAALDAWRADIDLLYEGGPRGLTARALIGPVAEFGLAKEDFHAVIDGMEMDAGAGIVAPDMETLMRYCANVAGAVGLLAIRIFGATGPTAEEFARSLGNALQLTNILRDLREDADMGRLYLPDELLSQHGITERDPQAVLAHLALPTVCIDLGKIAEDYYQRAEKALKECPSGPLRPAIVMMANYRLILDRLVRTGWQDIDRRVSVSKPHKLWLALRYGVLPH